MNKVDDTLMKQQALRNVASLPELLEKLQHRLGALPHQLQTSATGVDTKPQPPSNPAPKVISPARKKSISVPVKSKPRDSSSSESDSDTVNKKMERAKSFVGYLSSIQKALDENSDSMANEALMKDLHDKGFVVKTRESKTQKGLYKYLQGQIKKLNKVIEEEET